LGPIIEPSLGALLGALVLLDIFLLVLYARANTGLVSKVLTYWAWRFSVWVSPIFGRWQSTFLSLAGPAILVLVLTTWALLLSLSAALIIHPSLGTAIRTNHGETPTDFVTALYVGGSSLSFIGASDFVPQTSSFRLFYLLTSLIGMSLVTLTVTYLMELYSSLLARNVLGLKVHLLSLETGDAAEVVAGLGQRGMFEAGYTNLAEWATETAQTKESHHFYSTMIYFRFKEPFYSVSRTALVSLDTVALIKTALDDDEYGWLKESAAVEQLRRGTLLELKALTDNFIPRADLDSPPDAQTRALWQRRYAAGVARLQRSGIKTTDTGADDYIRLRTQWDRSIKLLAPQFAYKLDEIDTALAQLK
jgi:hypothetical protein